MGCTVAFALLLTACGSDSEQQGARTVTHTVTLSRPSSDEDSETTAAGSTAPSAPPGKPLPAGIVAADGRYTMSVRRTSFEQPGVNPALDDEYPSESDWRFETTCRARRCTIRMQRELESGGFKTIVLSADPERGGVYVGRSSGTTVCVSSDPKRVPARQRYAVKLSMPRDVDGRRTATMIETYLREQTNGCEVKPARASVSWSGSLQR